MYSFRLPDYSKMVENGLVNIETEKQKVQLGDYHTEPNETQSRDAKCVRQDVFGTIHINETQPVHLKK